MKNKISRSKFISNYKLLEECRANLDNVNLCVANSIMVIYDLLLVESSDGVKKINKSARGFVFLVDSDWYRIVDVSKKENDKIRFKVCHAYSDSRRKFEMTLSDIHMNNRLSLYYFANDLFNYLLVGTSSWQKFCGRDNYNLHYCMNMICLSGIERCGGELSCSYSLDIRKSEIFIDDEFVCKFELSMDFESDEIIKFRLINEEGKEIKADDLSLSYFVESFVGES